MDHMEGKGDKSGYGKEKLEESTTIKCFYTNVDTYLNKRDELQLVISVKSPDIIALTEVNSKNVNQKFAAADNEFDLKGYVRYSDLRGRGVSLYIKDCIGSRELVGVAGARAAVWCAVRLGSGDDLIIGLLYRSPNSSKEETSQMIMDINNVLAGNYKYVMIMGDLNFPEISWDTGTVLSGGAHVQEFLDCVRDNYLYQHVTSPTRYRGTQKANVLDLIMTNDEDIVKAVEHGEPLGKSDHVALYWRVDCGVRKKFISGKRYAYSKADYGKMRGRFAEVDWVSLLSDKTCDETWDLILDRVLSVIHESVPIVNFKTEHNKTLKPKWCNDNVLTKIKSKKKTFYKYKNSGTEHDYQIYKEARREVKRETRRAVRSYEKKIASAVKEDPKEFYKYFNSKRRTNAQLSSIVTVEGGHESDGNRIANEFNNFFQSVFTKEDMKNVPPMPDRVISRALTDIDFSCDDVLKILMNLKANKSAGPDEIYPVMLKECARELSMPLYILFRRSMDESYLPAIWKSANISPIHKKGDKSRVENYRPISLTSAVSKCFERLVRKAILDHMTENDLLSRFQHGFVPGRSCITQLLDVMDKWTEIVEAGGSIDVVYLDFAKAFDKVPHHRLLMKMKSYGIEGKVVGWVEAFIRERRQRVCMNGVRSEWIDVTSGVPQGSVLGPVLFTIFINDLPERVLSMMCLYADDSKIFREICSRKDADMLQRDLDSSVQWGTDWDMVYNTGKCHVMHINGDPLQTRYYMKSDNEVVELSSVEEERDLGVLVDVDLRFRNHIDQLVTKGNQLTGMIKRGIRYKSPDVIKRIFTTVVRPHLEYGNVIWHPVYKAQVNEIEKVQRRATRLIRRIRDWEYEERLKYLNLHSLTYRRFRGDAIEIYKYLHGRYNVSGDPVGNAHVMKGYDTRGHSLKLSVTQSKSRVRSNFLTCQMASVWNDLPSDIVDAPTIEAFKARLDRYMGEKRFTTDPKQLYSVYAAERLFV